MPGNRTLLEEETTRSIIGAFYAVYRELGPGRLEHVYVRALEYELRCRDHTVGREVRVPVFYRGIEIATERFDLIVDGRVVVEVKSTETLPRVALRQLSGYLRSTYLEVGLVLHFGPEKPEFRRVICDNAHKAHRGRSAPRSIDPH